MTESQPRPTSEAPAVPGKRPYRPPRLSVHGAVPALTTQVVDEPTVSMRL